VVRWRHLVNAYGVISLVRATNCSRLAPRVAASCLAEPSCYTSPARRYSYCPAWQLCIVFIDVLIYSAANLQVCSINLLYFTYFIMVIPSCPVLEIRHKAPKLPTIDVAGVVRRSSGQLSTSRHESQLASTRIYDAAVSQVSGAAV